MQGFHIYSRAYATNESSDDNNSNVIDDWSNIRNNHTPTYNSSQTFFIANSPFSKKCRSNISTNNTACEGEHDGKSTKTIAKPIITDIYIISENESRIDENGP